MSVAARCAFTLTFAGGRQAITLEPSLRDDSQTFAVFADSHRPGSTRPPRELAEHFFNVARWTEMTRGGHFAALEEPELLAVEIREFFRPLRSATLR